MRSKITVCNPLVRTIIASVFTYLKMSKCFQNVNVNAKACNGDTARSLALIHGHMKIVSLIENHTAGQKPLRLEAGKYMYKFIENSEDYYNTCKSYVRPICI